MDAPRWTLTCEDAFAMLARLPDGAVDHVICDPPFDDRTHVGARNCGETESRIDFPPFGAAELRRFVAEALRVSRRWVLAFCADGMLGMYHDAAGDAWIRDGWWHKPDGAPQFTGDRPATPGEHIAILHRAGAKQWNGGGHQAFWSVGVERTDRVHPTQKPLRLMLRLVQQFTDPGETILDPFAGSATTGVAALRHGCRFIGCEINPAMHALAVERLAAEDRGLTLSAARAGQGSLFEVSP